MLTLDLEPFQADGTIYVQDEPALEIALPQVFVQPELTALVRGKLPRVEALAAELFRRHQADPETPLGPDYQELVTEFQPLFAWAIACWDYLLSTEGCRFLPRNGKQRFGVRGDYYAVTDKEYSRLVHRIFRDCVFAFTRQSDVTSLALWLRERFWPAVVDAYQHLKDPPDPRQRTLTPYSYLRCVPYQFLNEYHDDLVYATTQRLPTMEWRAIDAYFLHFFTEPASADTLGASEEGFIACLRQGLTRLLINDRLVYCLLRQIERY